MVYTGRSTEESDDEGDLNCRDLAQDISDGQNFSMWPRDCSCDILPKNMSVFLPFSKKSAWG